MNGNKDLEVASEKTKGFLSEGWLQRMVKNEKKNYNSRQYIYGGYGGVRAYLQVCECMCV